MTIPALQAYNGTWAYDPVEKAQLLADTLSGKNKLPAEVKNEYSALAALPYLQREPRQFTHAEVESTLDGLDAQSGTGPDLLPTRILKLCSAHLAALIQRLANLILDSGAWPECWRIHWVAPIHKRSAVFLPQNYRGIHLTAQLSKVIERLLLSRMSAHISMRKLNGLNQFAYTKDKGARDVLALLTLRWVKAVDAGSKVLVYCSDVAGAFDKVAKKRLLDKLTAMGLHKKLIDIISSWLAPRKASVVVGGKESEPFEIKDMIFQGTVLGPQLWNLFFADAATAIQEHFFEEAIYADDLNAYKIVKSDTNVEQALTLIDNVQKELHMWGAANRVTFDPSKESKHILSRTDPFGPDFRLLGVSFDCRMDMEGAVHTLVGKTRWKIHMLLRSKRALSTESLITQYKQQVLSFIEYRTSAIYHATTTALHHLDRLQDKFLRELGVTREAALIDFGLAPLSMRRDIALLGLLHRAAIGKGPTHFQSHFRRTEGTLFLNDILANTRPSLLMKRSIWGLVRIYNTLGSSLQCTSVTAFQKLLQDRAKRVVVKQVWANWPCLYSPRTASSALRCATF